MIITIVVIILACLLTAVGAAFGVTVAPVGHPLRWPAYAGCAVVLTQFGWYPLLSLLDLRVGVTDQYVAVVLATVGIKFIMEWLVISEVSNG